MLCSLPVLVREDEDRRQRRAILIGWTGMSDLALLMRPGQSPCMASALAPNDTSATRSRFLFFSFLFFSRLQHASRILNVFIMGTRDRSGVMGVSHGENRGRLRSSSGQIIVGITMMICPLHWTVWGALRIHRSLTTLIPHPGLPCDPLSGLSSSISCPSSATTNHRPLSHSGLPA